jgi:hypothetical protein
MTDRVCYTCKFCNREMGFSVNHMEAYFCIDCNMIYVYNEDKVQLGYGFIVDHRNKQYRMIFRTHTRDKNKFYISINEPINEGIILELDIHPENITPQNAKYKLETYLTFM